PVAATATVTVTAPATAEPLSLTPRAPGTRRPHVLTRRWAPAQPKELDMEKLYLISEAHKIAICDSVLLNDRETIEKYVAEHANGKRTVAYRNRYFGEFMRHVSPDGSVMYETLLPYRVIEKGRNGG